jgi:ADP-ribose pyrophosphatase
MEMFAIPGAGGIIEKHENGVDYILVQERYKEEAPEERGMLEIPAGKIREYENVFDCLRREIREETGLEVVEIEGEKEASVWEGSGYKVLNYTPFCCSQNIRGSYPILVQVFLCTVEGELRTRSDESKNIRWILLSDLEKRLGENEGSFYPMHVDTLRKYLAYKAGR